MNKRAHRGFTLLELMITVAIFAIIVTMAVPSMRTLIRNNRLTTQANLFVSTLQYARSEAVKQRVNIGVEPLVAGVNWHQGWRIWVDTDGDSAFDVGPELELKQQGPLTGGHTLIAGGAGPVVYTGSGFTNGVIALFTWDLCGDLAGQTGRRVTMTASGRVDMDTAFACP